MFRAVREIASADGITRHALALIDALAAADSDGIFAHIQPAAEGRVIE